MFLGIDLGTSAVKALLVDDEQRALQRLARLLEKALQTPKKRVATRPTRGSRERRLAEKRRRSDRKRAYNPG